MLIMKNYLNFAYRKCLARSNIVDFNKVKALRLLLSIKLSKQLKKEP